MLRKLCCHYFYFFLHIKYDKFCFHILPMLVSSLLFLQTSKLQPFSKNVCVHAHELESMHHLLLTPLSFKPEKVMKKRLQKCSISFLFHFDILSIIRETQSDSTTSTTILTRTCSYLEAMSNADLSIWGFHQPPHPPLRD